jgi:uncharacterized cofD-like protein
LFLAALTEITGDFADAVKISSEILASKGHIYPATNEDVRLVAELDNGEMVHGETSISGAGHSIKKVWLEPEQCEPLPEALDAIHSADIITIGPGSLYTSLIPPILVEGVANAIAVSPATKIFISNLMTQPGETDGYSAHRHLEVFKQHAPQIDFDHVIVNNRPITKAQTKMYAEEGAEQIGVHGSISPDSIDGASIVYGDLLDEGDKVRHHPEKLAKVALICGMEPASKMDIMSDEFMIEHELVH